MKFKTTDLCDAHPDIQVAEPLLRHFGGAVQFAGPIRTLKIFEDNSLVRSTLETPGAGQVLVVDGGGSLRCALVGDQLGALAVQNGWAGIVVYGCVRDVAELAALPVGILALAGHPRRSAKRGDGQADLPVRFAGLYFTPGHYLYADADGLVVAPEALAQDA
jgi:regulator of ribonuclease activity A